MNALTITKNFKINFTRKKSAGLMSLAIAMMAFLITSCGNDDKLVSSKDYGLKTFSADFNYSNGDYMDQVYFSFSDSLVGTATQGTDDWTTFYLIADSSQYNITSSYVSDWDIVFTNYTTLATYAGTTLAYKVTGALINTEKNIQVATIDYTNSENTDSISSAFSDLSLSDVENLSYSSDVDAIGYDWKTINMTTYTYTVNTNYFYIIKLENGNYYKMRFVSFYGSTTSERIAKIEYQLMQ